MNTTPTLAEVIRCAIEHRLSAVHVALPGRIESYNVHEQTADVQPLINRQVGQDEERKVLRLPMVTRVPVVFPRAGGYFVSFPVQPGDTVLLVFCERSIDAWFAAGGEVAPVDVRMHSLSDAVAIPGFYDCTQPLKQAHAQNLVIGKDGGAQIHIKENGEVHLGAENVQDFIALASLVDARLSNIESALNSFMTTFNAHAHPVAGVTAGPTTTPAVPATPGQSVAATKIKAV